MTIRDAQKLQEAAYNWFQNGTEENSKQGVVIRALTFDEYGGEAFVVPLSFEELAENKGWSGAKTPASISELIRRMQRSIEEDSFEYASEIYITHSRNYLIVILGTENVAKYREGASPSVFLEFPGVAKSSVPSFKLGDELVLKGSSPVRGWVYLFSIDNNRQIDAVYPREGDRSTVRLSRNEKKDLSECINAKIAPVLRFAGPGKGMERLVVVVVDTEEAVPVTCAHVRSQYPLPLLFAHEQKSKGIAPAAGPQEATFDQLGLDQIAIGTLDYYYEG